LDIARSFAREGATIIINGRTEKSVADAIAQLRQELPSAQFLPLAADNGTPEGGAQTIAALRVDGGIYRSAV